MANQSSTWDANPFESPAASKGSGAGLTAEQVARLQEAFGDRAKIAGSSTKAVSADEYARRLAQDIAEDRALAKRAQQDNIEKALKEWKESIEPRWRDAELSMVNPESKPYRAITDKVKRWRSGKGLNELSLLLVGALGRGKTYMGYVYINALISQGLLHAGQVFVSTERTLAAVATSGFEKEKRMRDIISPRYKFFLIDDIGRGAFGNSESARGEIWFELLNHIYSNQLAFVGTTNLRAAAPKGEPSDLQRWIGSASWERLGHIVGSSGYLHFSEEEENMRKVVGQQWEDHYQKER